MYVDTLDRLEQSGPPLCEDLPESVESGLKSLSLALTRRDDDLHAAARTLRLDCLSRRRKQ
jgi:hypothetical protein